MHSEYYSFGGLTIRLCCEEALLPSPICVPFAVQAEKADHTIIAAFSDTMPPIPANAACHEMEYCWQEGKRACLERIFGSQYMTFSAREGDTTRVLLSGGYRGSVSARTILESAGLMQLLAEHGMLILHSSYIRMADGRGLVFSGHSGVGKSTQAALWEQFAAAQVINGDRALLRPVDSTAHGIIYSGTSGICGNVSAPLAAIVLPRQASENLARPCPPRVAFARLLNQCAYYPGYAPDVERMTELVAQLVSRVPVFELDCRMDEQAVRTLQNELRSI